MTQRQRPPPPPPAPRRWSCRGYPNTCSVPPSPLSRGQGDGGFTLSRPCSGRGRASLGRFRTAPAPCWNAGEPPPLGPEPGGPCGAGPAACRQRSAGRAPPRGSSGSQSALLAPWRGRRLFPRCRRGARIEACGSAQRANAEAGRGDFQNLPCPHKRWRPRQSRALQRVTPPRPSHPIASACAGVTWSEQTNHRHHAAPPDVTVLPRWCDGAGTDGREAAAQVPGDGRRYRAGLGAPHWGAAARPGTGAGPALKSSGLGLWGRDWPPPCPAEPPPGLQGLPHALEDTGFAVWPCCCIRSLTCWNRDGFRVALCWV